MTKAIKKNYMPHRLEKTLYNLEFDGILLGVASHLRLAQNPLRVGWSNPVMWVSKLQTKERQLYHAMTNRERSLRQRKGNIPTPLSVEVSSEK